MTAVAERALAPEIAAPAPEEVGPSAAHSASVAYQDAASYCAQAEAILDMESQQRGHDLVWAAQALLGFGEEVINRATTEVSRDAGEDLSSHLTLVIAVLESYLTDAPDAEAVWGALTLVKLANTRINEGIRTLLDERRGAA